MIDNNGYVLAPLPVAPLNETDMVLLPKGLHALKQVAKEVGLDLRGAYVNLDGGFDSRANRKCIFHTPSHLVVAHWASDVENSAPLDFLLRQDLWTPLGRLMRLK